MGRFRAVIPMMMSALAIGSSADAATIGYGTRGYVRPWADGQGAAPGVIGPGVLRFEGTSGAIDGSSPFRLGAFVVDPPAGWAGTTYRDAAFASELRTDRGGNVSPNGPGDVPYSDLTIRGVLDGTIAPGRSDLVATIRDVGPTPMAYVPEDPKNFLLDLPFPMTALGVDRPASPIGAAGTTLWARVHAAPEPGTFLPFLAAAGLAMGRRRCRSAPGVARRGPGADDGKGGPAGDD